MITHKPVSFEEETFAGAGKTKYKLEDTSVFVEELAQHIYRNEGYETLWTENDYWWEVAALLFWDVIFARVRGAVLIRKDGIDVTLDPSDEDFEPSFHVLAIQSNGMPQDFFTLEFYQRRKDIITNRLKELENSDITEKLSRSFQKNYGKLCRPIEEWNKFPIDQILKPLSHFRKDVVLAICHRLLRDFANNRSGLPDLLVFGPQDAFFVEVKSRRDRVSEEQQEWHNFLSDDLNQRVELFLVNHSPRQLANPKKPRESL